MAGTTTIILGMNLFSNPVLAETVSSTGADTGTPQTTGSAGSNGTGKGRTTGTGKGKDADDEELAEKTDEKNQSTTKDGEEQPSAESRNKPVINQMSKDDLKKCVKDASDKNPLSIAGVFHIFGNKVDCGSSSHMAGNVATDKLNSAGDFGTDDSATSNATTGDIQYFGKITRHFNQFDGNNRVVVFGPDIEYRPYGLGNQTEINLGTAENLNWQSFNIRYDEIIQADKKLDIQGKLDKLSEKSKNQASHSQTEGVDINSNTIDLTNAQPKKDEPIYVDVNVDLISGDKKNLTIKGITAGADTTAVILNVREIQNKDLSAHAHLTLNYTDGSDVGGPNNTHSQFNKLLWNLVRILQL